MRRSEEQSPVRRSEEQSLAVRLQSLAVEEAVGGPVRRSEDLAVGRSGDQ